MTGKLGTDSFNIREWKRLGEVLEAKRKADLLPKAKPKRKKAKKCDG